MSYQKIILVGNLGRDPEMRYTPSGTPVTNFSLATNEKFNGKDGEAQERTTWWRIAVWGRMAEACNQYLSKGRQVLVEGRMSPDPETGGPRVYQRQDGTHGAQYEVTALRVQFLGGKNGNGNAAAGASDEDVPPDVDVDADAIPF